VDSVVGGGRTTGVQGGRRAVVGVGARGSSRRCRLGPSRTARRRFESQAPVMHLVELPLLHVAVEGERRFSWLCANSVLSLITSPSVRPNSRLDSIPIAVEVGGGSKPCGCRVVLETGLVGLIPLVCGDLANGGAVRRGELSTVSSMFECVGTART
jgi:hypothetical protein